LQAPAVDQIEVTVFGPGFGECIVVHLGASKWLIVDSCIDSASSQPAALNHLTKIGVDPAQVVMVIATHWHDDHIRGMARQLRACVNARFCTSSALTRSEFVATIVQYNSRHGIVAGSGATEMCEVLEILRSRAGATSPVRASPARHVLTIPAAESGHGSEAKIITLSPSDKQFDKFLASLSTIAPVPLTAKRRMADQDPNDVSVATLLAIGDQGILLGADLEENGDEELGWSAVVKLAQRPKADIFKVPHHGSKNAHCDAVWQEMLGPNPIAIIAPWSRNQGLPTKADVARLGSKTHSGFITSVKGGSINRARPYAVTKQIRETVGRIRSSEIATGFVSVRNGGKRNSGMWCVSRSDNAAHASEWA